jgi:hypothetical protein
MIVVVVVVRHQESQTKAKRGFQKKVEPQKCEPIIPRNFVGVLSPNY